MVSLSPDPLPFTPLPGTLLKVHGTVLVTNEVFDSNARRRVPLPNLCRQFDVTYCNTIDMLRGLVVQHPSNEG